VFASLRYFLADVAHWIASHKLICAVIVVAILGAGAGVYLALSQDDEVNTAASAPLPAPRVVVADTPEPEDTGDLGFPAFATKNTTRVAGADSIADAAAVALAVYPSTGGVPPRTARSLCSPPRRSASSPRTARPPRPAGRRS
jgi:hypothetical protein